MEKSAEQQAEERYPYFTEDVVGNRLIDMLRQGYIAALIDQPQLTEAQLLHIINSMERRKFDTEAETEAYLLAFKDLILEVAKRGLGVGDGWIDVRDRLPNDDKLDFCINVLCVLNNGLQCTYSFIKQEDNRGKFYFNYGSVFDDVTDYVTHWMPLPKAPNP